MNADYIMTYSIWPIVIWRDDKNVIIFGFLVLRAFQR